MTIHHVVMLENFLTMLIKNELETTENDTKAAGYVILKGANFEVKPLEVSFDDCVDRHKTCVTWADHGQCPKNPGWMAVNCPLSCNYCHLRDPLVRCDRARLNISTEHIYKSGDLDDMFSSIDRDFGDRCEVNVLSKSPWVVTLDNFVSDEEIEAILSSVKGH